MELSRSRRPAPATSEADEAFDMANLRPDSTGLPFVVFISQRGNARHGPRVKVSPLPRYNPTEAQTVTLERPPRVLGTISQPELTLLSKCIELNRQTLEDYWDGTIEYTEDMLRQIKRI